MIRLETVVEASIEEMWTALIEKIRHPELYVPGVERCEMLKDEATEIIRKIYTVTEDTITERIVLAEAEKQVEFILVKHPFFTGSFRHSLEVREGGNYLVFENHWTAKTKDLDLSDFEEIIRVAMLETKALMEGDVEDIQEEEAVQ